MEQFDIEMKHVFGIFLIIIHENIDQFSYG